MGVFSLALHILLVVLLTLFPWPNFLKVQPKAYTVTLMPVSIPEPLSVMREELPKPIEKPKKNDIVEKVKKPPPKRDLHRLHEALEEIRKKAALDEIQKRIARRERNETSPSKILISSTKQSLLSESELNEYYGLIWLKIKESWTIPENLIKEMVDLETIIVLIIGRDGKIQKWWFEKKSGNDLYDQSVVRAIKKADPLPPIPKGLSENTLEIGIRFYPE
jgi:TonB family protein